MAAPTAEEIKELWSVHLGPEATAERERRANAFDDTRSWVDPNGYRLSDRVWRQRAEIRSQVDQVLRQAIRTGEDALLTAKKLEQYLDPAYAPVRTEKGRLKRNQARSIVTTAPGRGGSGSFPARRLARTEITRAHGQATIWTAERTPFAKGVKWNLSGRHPKADECDRNASQDSGLGRGVYATKDVPRYPSHPQDLCNLSVVTEDDVDAIVKSLREQYELDEVTAEATPVDVPVTVDSTRPQPPEFKSPKEAEAWASANLKTPISGFKGTDIQSVREVLDTLSEIEYRTGGAIPGSVQFGGIKGKAYGQFDPKTNTLHLRTRYEDIEARRQADDVEWRRRYGPDIPFHATTDLRGLVWHESGHAFDFEQKYAYRKSLASLPLETRRKLLNVSGYSGEDFSYGQGGVPPLAEAWAESFAAVATNSPRAAFVPDEVKAIINKVLKR